MKARLATIITVLALVGGTGGALAVAGGSSGSGHGPSAAGSEYKGGKHCGRDRHHGRHHHYRNCPHPRHHGDGDGDGGGDGQGHGAQKH